MRLEKSFEQGTKEWHDIRRGRITGTALQDVMGTPWNRLQLISELVAEEGTEQTKQFRSTPEMERGSAEEPFALQAFQERYNKEVERVGFCVSDQFDWIGYSPDGLIKDENGKYSEGIEIKNPNSSTLILYKILNLVPGIGSSAKKPFLGVPADYKWQVVHAFLVNDDLEKLYFAIYDARFISDQDKLYVVEVERTNPEMIEALKESREALVAFRAEWLRCKALVLTDNF